MSSYRDKSIGHKRQKLGQLVGTKYVSDSALSDILHSLKEEDLSNVPTSRRSLRRTLQDVVNQQTMYGPVMTSIKLPLDSGGDMDWDVPMPAALLSRCMQVQNLALLVLEIHREKPSSLGAPWKLLYFADECTAGNNK